MDSLTVVGRALSLAMHRFNIDANHAFDYLDESAARADLSLHDYADQLVDRAGMSRSASVAAA